MTSYSILFLCQMDGGRATKAHAFIHHLLILHLQSANTINKSHWLILDTFQIILEYQPPYKCFSILSQACIKIA
jgi:hypothetical protein